MPDTTQGEVVETVFEHNQRREAEINNALKQEVHSGGKHLSRYVRSRRKLTLLAKNRGPVHYSEPRDQATMPSFGLFVYRSGRSPDWIKSKNPNAPAVKRKAELGR